MDENDKFNDSSYCCHTVVWIDSFAEERNTLRCFRVFGLFVRGGHDGSDGVKAGVESATFKTRNLSGSTIFSSSVASSFDGEGRAAVKP